MSELLLVTASSKTPKPLQDAAPGDKSASTCHGVRSMIPPHCKGTARHPLSPCAALLPLQLGRCRNPKVPSFCSIYLCYKLVLFPELLWSSLLDGLFDRAQQAVRVGASAAEDPVSFREKEQAAC